MLKILIFLVMSLISYSLGINYISYSVESSHYLHQMMIGLSFLIGLTASLNQFKEIFLRNKKLIMIFFGCKVLVSPIVSFSIYVLFGCNPNLLSLIVIGIVPSAMISVAFSKIYGGNYLLNIVCTLLMILITPLSIPILSKMYLGKFIDFDSINIMLSTFNLVVLPMIVGIILNSICSNKLNHHIIDYLIIAIVSMMIFSISQNQMKIPDLIYTVMPIILYILSMYLISILLLGLFDFTKYNQIAFKHEMSLSDAALAIILSRDILNQSVLIPVEAAILQILMLILLNFIGILRKLHNLKFILCIKQLIKHKNINI